MISVIHIYFFVCLYFVLQNLFIIRKIYSACYSCVNRIVKHFMTLSFHIFQICHTYAFKISLTLIITLIIALSINSKNSSYSFVFPQNNSASPRLSRWLMGNSMMNERVMIMFWTCLMSYNSLLFKVLILEFHVPIWLITFGVLCLIHFIEVWCTHYILMCVLFALTFFSTNRSYLSVVFETLHDWIAY